jgi:hypothetical protein
MKTVTIKIGEKDIEDLQTLFKNEENFKPQVHEDFLIIGILKQVLENPKTELSDESNS